MVHAKLSVWSPFLIHHEHNIFNYLCRNSFFFFSKTNTQRFPLLKFLNQFLQFNCSQTSANFFERSILPCKVSLKNRHFDFKKCFTRKLEILWTAGHFLWKRHETDNRPIPSFYLTFLLCFSKYITIAEISLYAEILPKNAL